MTFRDLCTFLDANQVVVMVTHISDAFYQIDSQGLDDGCTQETARAKHAVIAVGYGMTPTGGDAVLVRNSWGPAWAEDGYAWIAWNYFKARMIDCGPLVAGKGGNDGNAC